MTVKSIKARMNEAGQRFAGREALAEGFSRRESLREEIADEFMNFMTADPAASTDGRKASRSMTRALGVPVRVVKVPEPAVSEKEIMEISAEIAGKGKPADA